MTQANEISAQVVLLPADGTPPGPDEAITAATIERFRPSAQVAERAQKSFRAAGFETGPCVGNSFSISAPAAAFRRILKSTGRKSAPAEWVGLEIQAADLPAELAEGLLAIVFPQPPEFGPGSF